MDDRDTDGSTLRDRSAYDNHGNISSGVSKSVSGPVGEAYGFSSSGGIACGNLSEIDLTGDITLSFWVRADNPSANRETILDKAYGGVFTVNIEDDAQPYRIQVYHGDNGGNSNNYESSTWSVINPTELTHIVIRRDTSVSEEELWKDGVSQGTQGYSITSIVQGNNGITIGNGYTSNLDGIMDDVRIYNRALSESEINQLYQMREQKSNNKDGYVSRPKPGNPNNLIDYSEWKASSNTFGSNFDLNGGSGDNDIVIGKGPYFEEQINWYGYSSTNDDGADGGWNHNIPYEDIDETSKYRYSVWAKSEYDTGSVYHGTDKVEDFSGNAQGNPYYWSGNLPTNNDWYLIVGYNYPAGSSFANDGRIYGTNGDVYDWVTDYRWPSSVGSDVTQRSYYYYDSNTDTPRGVYFADPRFEKCDGTETPISQMLMSAQNRTSLKRGLVGHFISNANSIENGNLIDRSEQQNDATGGNTLTEVDGKLHKALDTDGNTVSWDNQAFRNAVTNNEFSISLWIRQQEQANSYDWSDVVRFDNTGQRLERANADVSNNQDYWCNLGNESTNLATDDIGVANDTWWHCVVRSSSSENSFAVYVNGSQDKERATESNSDPGTISINPHNYGGYIEDLRFYKRPLDEQEIKTLYERGLQ